MSSVTETINAGTWREFFEPGDFFRLLETTAPVTVEFYAAGRKIVDVVNIQAGYAEYFRGGNLVMFDRVRIYSATTQQVGFVTRFGSDVRYDRGASSVTGTVALDAATLAALEQINVRPESETGSWGFTAVTVANSAQTIFTPASNLNGAILLSAGFSIYGGASAPSVSIIAKSSAPANVLDGSIIFGGGISLTASGGGNLSQGTMPKEQFIPAGLGLYFITDIATTSAGGGSYRSCRYKLL
jgi:hypothetical protein